MCFSDQGEYVCFDSKGTDLLNELDRQFLSFVQGRDLQSFSIPALIHGEVLSKCGYFESFPDQIMAVGTFDKGYWDRITDGAEPSPEHFVPQREYLTPAACLHIYPMLQDQLIETNLTITTRARVYRHETKGRTALTRLWDFMVREFVFIGEEAFVRDSLEEMKKKALNTANEICGEGQTVRAHDNFFPSARNQVKARIQMANAQKIELRARVQGQLIALTSFNFHGTHFSAAFHFDNERRIVTGCAGFGLERWVAASLERGSPGLWAARLFLRD